MQSYGYADNTPATLSDPSGLRICLEECGSADDKEFQKVVAQRRAHSGDFGVVQGSCTRQSASDCDPEPPSPTKVVNRVIFPNNTILSYLANGVVLINGVVLPPGCADPYKLAADMDKDADKAEVDPKTGMAYDGTTAALMVRSCDRQVAGKLCTLDMRTKMDELHQKLLAGSGTIGICLNAGLVAGPALGGQVCLVSGSDGVAITISGLGGAGTPGAGASITIQETTAASLKDLCGPFTYVAGSYGLASGGFASGGGVLVSEVGAGVGSSGVQGGETNTIAVLTFGKSGVHNKC
jgi:hypothetical protein